MLKKPLSQKKGPHVRLGSTNRVADHVAILEIQRAKAQKYFDEQAHINSSVTDIDLDLAKKLFSKVKKKFTEKTAQSLDLLVPEGGKTFPSNGGILLFGDVTRFFPDVSVRLVRFLGTDKAEVLDHQDYEGPLVSAIEPAMAFVRRNTAMAAKFGGIQREDIPQYPPAVVREAITNAILHADYALRAPIQIAIFEDRIEITNPGALPFGLDMATALSGVSQLRNRVIGRVFRELHIIEQWGSGFGRMIQICQELGIPEPKFEEIGNFFRVTLYHRTSRLQETKSWDAPIITHIKKKKKITAKEAQQIWQVTSRTTSSRLNQMIKKGKIAQISTSPFDPQKVFVLAK